VSDIFVLFQPNLEFLDRFSQEVPNTKFYENPSSGNRADTHGQTDRMELIGAFRDNAKTHKNGKSRKFFLGCLIENGSTTTRRRFRNYSPNDTASLSRTPASSATSP
jgi:hypothetical protein